MRVNHLDRAKYIISDHEHSITFNKMLENSWIFSNIILFRKINDPLRYHIVKNIKRKDNNFLIRVVQNKFETIHQSQFLYKEEIEKEIERLERLINLC